MEVYVLSPGSCLGRFKNLIFELITSEPLYRPPPVARTLHGALDAENGDGRVMPDSLTDLRLTGDLQLAWAAVGSRSVAGKS